MIRIKRPAAAAGAAVLLAFSLSACGGPPTDASKEDYCDAVNDNSALNDIDFENPDEEAFVDALKEQAEKLEEVGTPEDIPDDAREGFEIQLETIQGFSADDWEEAFNSESDEDPFEKDLSSDEKKKVDAYTEYENETCDDSESDSDSGSSDEATSEGATELPTEDLPTDIPTDGIPTDIPTDLSPEDLASLQSELEKLTESAATE